MTAEYSVGTATAHLTVLDHLFGDGNHHLGILAAGVTDHGKGPSAGTTIGVAQFPSLVVVAEPGFERSRSQWS